MSYKLLTTCILILLTSCQQTCMMYTIAVCTVKNSWWWTKELFETCRVLFQKSIWEISASSWFCYKNLSQCTATWTSNLALFTRLYNDAQSTRHKITTVYQYYFKCFIVLKVLYLLIDVCLPDDSLGTIKTCLRCSVLITELHIDVVHLVYCNMTILFFSEMPITVTFIVTPCMLSSYSIITPTTAHI